MNFQNPPYNGAVASAANTLSCQVVDMPKEKAALPSGELFGVRLVQLRKAAGYTLEELGNEVGLSKRMVCYYERQGGQPPIHLLPRFAKALGVSVDELLGSKPIKRNGAKPQRDRLWQRFKQVEKLPPEDRRQVVQFVDTVLDRARLKEKVTA